MSGEPITDGEERIGDDVSAKGVQAALHQCTTGDGPKGAGPDGVASIRGGLCPAVDFEELINGWKII